MSLVHIALLLAFTASTTLACDKFPNGTETQLHWWANDGPVKYYNATPEDQSGTFEYPVHLSKPLVVQLLIDSAKSNLDACTHGIKCPIPAGNQQWIAVTLDFTEFSAIIALLKDDAPYQLEYKLTDRDTNDVSIFTAQAHAYTKN